MLHEKTQRRLFRALFLLGCVLPTLAIGSWSLAKLHPLYGETVLGLAGRAIGVGLECDQLATPRPGEYEIKGLRITHPDSGEQIATCDRLRLRHAAGEWRFVANKLVVIKRESALPNFSTSSAQAPSVEGQIGSLEVADSSGVSLCHWKRVQCELGASAQTKRSGVAETPIVTVWTEATKESDRARIVLSRLQDSESASLRLTLQTGATPIPCQLCPGLSIPESMARTTTFVGKIEAEVDSTGSQGWAEGVVSLAPLTAEHVSWSSAQVELLDVRWTGKRIDRLHARVDAQSGSFNRLFVWGLHHMLSCQPRAALNTIWESTPANEPIPFDRLACEVELDSSGLVLYGRCGEQEGLQRGGALARAILANGDEPLLLEPRERPQPLSGFVRALWPDAAPELPATAEAHAVASRLPLPSQTPALVR